MTTTETKPFVPDFGDDEEDRTIAFVCSKGSLDMAYPGLIMANGAIESGMEAHLFFTFWGMDMITKKRQDHLHFSPVGNPAAHMPAALAPLPGMQTMATSMMKKQIADLGIPSVPEFIEMCRELGVTFFACATTMGVMGVERDDLVPEAQVAGAAAFLDFAASADVQLYV